MFYKAIYTQNCVAELCGNRVIAEKGNSHKSTEKNVPRTCSRMLTSIDQLSKIHNSAENIKFINC